MSIHLYALRLEPSQLVAAEVSEATAARLIDACETVFLGTESELIALARRKRKSVTIFARQTGPGRNAAPDPRQPAAVPARPHVQPAPAPVRPVAPAAAPSAELAGVF